MKKCMFIAVAVIAVLSSCTKNNDDFGGGAFFNPDKLVFTATMEGYDQTKATFNDSIWCAEWEVGDKISINGYLYSAQSAGTTTTFVADGDDTPDSSYMAFFPAPVGNTGLPANVREVWKDGKFNMPMYAASLDTTLLSFKNICGVLKITVKDDQLDKVKSIRVSSTNCATSGQFSIISDTLYLDNPDSIANAVTVTYTKAVTTDSIGKAFYVAIPPQAYKNLKIELSSDSINFIRCMTVNKGIEIKRNNIYPIFFADNEPAKRGTAKAFIDGDSVDVNWVQLWKDGPKFAEYNIGATWYGEDGGLYCCGGTKKFGENNWSNDHYVNTNKEIVSSLPDGNDTAKKLWGSNWRMPTIDEFRELAYKCVFSGRFVYSQNVSLWGANITGKGYYADNSIYLPAAGYVNSSKDVVYERTLTGCYWTSSLSVYEYSKDKITNGMFLRFMVDRAAFTSRPSIGNNGRSLDCGQSVRAVLNE